MEESEAFFFESGEDAVAVMLVSDSFRRRFLFVAKMWE